MKEFEIYVDGELKEKITCRTICDTESRLRQEYGPSRAQFRQVGSGAFYFVKCGDQIRISQKVADPIAACLDCVGIATDRMLVKFISGQANDVRKYGLRKRLMESQKGWIIPTKESVFPVMVP